MFIIIIIILYKRYCERGVFSHTLSRYRGGSNLRPLIYKLKAFSTELRPAGMVKKL